GMTFPEGKDLYANVKNNNNIVWKNVHVVEDTGGGRFGWVTVANLGKQAHTAKLTFGAPAAKSQKSILDHGAVTVHLGERLAGKLREGTAAKGMKVAGSALHVAEYNAALTNLRLQPNEVHTIKVEFTPQQRKVNRNEVFTFQVIQHGEDGKVVG